MLKYIIRKLIKEQLQEQENRIKSHERRLSDTESQLSNREVQCNRLLNKVDERIFDLMSGTERLDKHIDNKLMESFRTLDEYEKLKRTFNILGR